MARSTDILETPIEYLKGVGPARAEVLQKEAGIYTFYHLLYYFPFRYVDRSRFYNVTEINDDSTWIQLKGKLLSLQKIGKPRSQRLSAYLKDDSGIIELVWFKGIKWIEKSLEINKDYVVFGKPNYFNHKFNIPHPEMETLEDASTAIVEKLQPFYSSTEKLKARGLDSKGFRKIMKNLMVQVEGHLPETLSVEIISNLKLIPRREALISIHFPPDNKILDRAKARLKFEELFFIQLNLLKLKLLRLEKVKGHFFKNVGNYFNDFYHNNLPFELTDAQKRVVKEIRQDTGTGKQMNRLLQGDVGSGKTLVALMSMLIALDNGFQTALMAPTEILAQQHYKTIMKMLDGLDIQVALLTGSTKTKQRQALLKLLGGGDIHILIGTHALIEDTVQFSNLGLVVIDEQHRFGVAQRARLWEKNTIPPHVLVMTATPIPRTLAMTFYGDLDVSVIDELPPGRKPVKTAHYYDKDRLKVFGFLKKQIAEGRQVYVVYPLINESEKLDLKDLQDGYDSISRSFPLPDYAISIVHGKMKSKDKEFEMQRFVKGETDIMVSTTVIEVGVDVPNASVMVIENAERFGLSQLHQLRGRVGRGADQSFCILMSKVQMTNDGRQRIKTMVNTTDGFEIAEADLKLRGPGDLHGTQQSGILDLKIADIVKDEKILRYARSAAIQLLEYDPELLSEKNQAIAKHLKQINSSKTNWSLIS
ncbi:MAG: ATP-dependent DNA helicase RecG [Bacteroidales bacterium]|nr:ATP-dependent DNA helicase RecG [Bacteroidales bacterium]MCF8402689.1 ATP-dependent DNA helicase RecG [Bacteroidales bacterium]